MTSIRKISIEDNQAVGTIVQTVLTELGAPKVGTAYADPHLFNLFEIYQQPKSVYYVIENDNKIIGGGGIAPLENSTENICELQKMYFLPEARGLGLGSKLMELCLNDAKKFGFEKCYLETLPYMTDAQKLYQKFDFQKLSEPIGNTGHNSCSVWMLKNLNEL